MLIKVERTISNNICTFGKLYIDEIFQCYTLEDPFHATKIYGKTRIPAGTYEIGLQKSGPMNDMYKIKFPSFHQGMLEIKNIPNYTSVYIHIGNTAEDTKGCLLVGTGMQENLCRITGSTQAYVDLYPQVLRSIRLHESVKIIFRDLDKKQK